MSPRHPSNTGPAAPFLDSGTARLGDAFAALTALLRQLGEIVAAADDDHYTRDPVGVISGSLGGHVRHCLDHVDALYRGAATGEMDYDDRRRGTPIETDRLAALAAIADSAEQIEQLASVGFDRPIRLTTLIRSDAPSLVVQSSLGRELAFVISHTVHHNALIAAMGRTLGLPLPPRFGYAPSTVAHLERSACVLSPSCR